MPSPVYYDVYTTESQRRDHGLTEGDVALVDGYRAATVRDVSDAPSKSFRVRGEPRPVRVRGRVAVLVGADGPEAIRIDRLWTKPYPTETFRGVKFGQRCRRRAADLLAEAEGFEVVASGYSDGSTTWTVLFENPEDAERARDLLWEDGFGFVDVVEEEIEC